MCEAAGAEVARRQHSASMDRLRCRRPARLAAFVSNQVDSWSLESLRAASAEVSLGRTPVLGWSHPCTTHVGTR